MAGKREVVGASRHTMRRLKALAGDVDADVPGLPPRLGAQTLVAKNGASTIAARSGSTLSSQTCTVYTATSGTLASSSRTISVYNLSTTAIAANAYVIAAFIDGIWIAIWEDC